MTTTPRYPHTSRRQHPIAKHRSNIWLWNVPKPSVGVVEDERVGSESWLLQVSPCSDQVYTADRAATIEVADNGTGIPSADLPRVFERFYRVDEGRSRQTGGTGLGLAIVKHVAEEHGGHVEAESVLGEGSAFRIVIPLDSCSSQIRCREWTRGRAAGCRGRAASRSKGLIPTSPEWWVWLQR